VADYPDFTYRGDVDIIAQTIARLSVDIAAQTLATLGINIIAMDLAELLINVHAQDVGVYIERDWAATQDEDLTGTGSVSPGDATESFAIDYTVLANYVLYVDEITWSGWSTERVGLGSRLIYRLYIDSTKKWEVVDQGITANLAFYWTYKHTFSTPIKVAAGEHLKLGFLPSANGGTLYGNFNGRLYSV